MNNNYPNSPNTETLRVLLSLLQRVRQDEEMSKPWEAQYETALRVLLEPNPMYSDLSRAIANTADMVERYLPEVMTGLNLFQAFQTMERIYNHLAAINKARNDIKEDSDDA